MRNSRQNNKGGFTIVELIVVIVAIAILATIVFVSYRGITGTANDASVQHDLRDFADKVKLTALDRKTDVWTNDYGPVTANALDSIGWVASRDAYDMSVARNVVFCYNRGVTWSDGTHSWATAGAGGKVWALIALSKSGSIFYVTNDRDIPTKYTGATPMIFDATENVCGVFLQEVGAPGFGGVYHGYNKDDQTTGPWRSWTGQ